MLPYTIIYSDLHTSRNTISILLILIENILKNIKFHNAFLSKNKTFSICSLRCKKNTHYPPNVQILSLQI